MHHLIGVSSDNQFFGQGEVEPDDEMDRFNEEVVDLVIDTPNINNLSTKIVGICFVALTCLIVLVRIRESDGLLKEINKYVSSQLFLVTFGAFLAAMEFVCWYFDWLNHQPIWISSEVLGNIRIPILFYSCYTLYSTHFARQVIYITIYGFVGRFVFLAICGLLIKHISSSLLGMKLMTYAQATCFAAVTAVVDPLTAFRVFKDTSQRNFFLLLGIYTLGNSVAYEVFGAGMHLVHFSIDKHLSVHCYIALVLLVLRNIYIALLLGFLVGMLTALLTRLTRNNKSCEMYEPFITIAGPLLTLLICKWWALNVIYGVMVCCLVQERYVFMNMASRSVTTVKVGLESLANLANIISFVFIGYVFFGIFAKTGKDIEAALLFAVTVLMITYAVRIVIILITTVFINVRKRRPIGTRLQMLLVFAGVRGPYSFGMILQYDNAPFSSTFKDAQVFLIIWSIIFDYMISKIIIRNIRDRLEQLQEKHIEDNEIFPWPEVVEENVDDIMSCVFTLEHKLYSYVVTNKEELNEETRKKRERDRLEALKKVDDIQTDEEKDKSKEKQPIDKISDIEVANMKTDKEKGLKKNDQKTNISKRKTQ